MSSEVEWDIQVFAVYSRIFVILLQIVFNAVIPDHDAKVFSPPPALKSRTSLDHAVEFLLGGFRRWDGVYFIHIAEYGYTYENTVAFFPLFPSVVGKLTEVISIFSDPYLVRRNVALVIAVTVNFFLFVKTAKVLYHLGVFVLKDRNLAYKSAMLFCVNSGSIFFSATYSEAIYTFILFNGMLYASRGKHLIASTLFGLAAAARSNGVVALGFVAHAVGQSVLKDIYVTYHSKISGIARDFRLVTIVIKEFIQSMFYLFLCLLPIAVYQYYIYDLFCVSQAPASASHIVEYGRSQNYVILGDEPSEWCNYSLPLSYNYIQSKHWDVGFFNYYQFKQIPNFILAAPIIFLSVSACACYYRLNKHLCLRLGFLFDVDLKKTDKRDDVIGYPSTRLFPFIVHLLALTVFGCLFIHIQILTRLLCSSSPVIYWYAAHCTRRKLHPESNHSKAEERKYLTASEALSHRNNVVLDDIYCWKDLNINSKLIYTYFFSYLVIGTVAFSNFLPWT
ncbi:GPI mannosyltransferase 2-like [Gigantopelta aegis]|uniref:GPI mannosyltransferase 2-like n=1 Tax=Gigantopelta aegis TaxID=1735272 RepID=UPI001B889630|nr:GPI mannosyltransferase 2-like [Gigantopelta aegis]